MDSNMSRNYGIMRGIYLTADCKLIVDETLHIVLLILFPHIFSHQVLNNWNFFAVNTTAGNSSLRPGAVAQH